MPAGRLCVYCGRRPMDPAWAPFCSERCKTADLGRWLSGEYRIPGEPIPSSDDNDDDDDA